MGARPLYARGAAAGNALDGGGPGRESWPVLEMVTQREVEKIFAVTDRLGIHRESLVIPLGPRHPGRARRMPNGKIEIVVESQEDFDQWLAALEPDLARLAAPATR
jgi:hypothetical protein